MNSLGFSSVGFYLYFQWMFQMTRGKMIRPFLYTAWLSHQLYRVLLSGARHSATLNPFTPFLWGKREQKAAAKWRVKDSWSILLVLLSWQKMRSRSDFGMLLYYSQFMSSAAFSGDILTVSTQFRWSKIIVGTHIYHLYKNLRCLKSNSGKIWFLWPTSGKRHRFLQPSPWALVSLNMDSDYCLVFLTDSTRSICIYLKVFSRGLKLKCVLQVLQTGELIVSLSS